MLRYIDVGGGLVIPCYNLMVGTGIALAMLFLQYQKTFRSAGNDFQYKIHISLLLSIIAGFMGAFLFDAYTQHISLSLHSLHQVGLTFLGGFLSGLLMLAISLRLFHIPVLATFHMLTPSFCIGHFCGRLGCFMAGCCYGKPTDSILGIGFPAGSLPAQQLATAATPVNVYPTQLFEAAYVLLLFLSFMLFLRQNRFFIYLSCYAVFRFFIEFIRADNRGTIFNQHFLSPSQYIAVAMLLAMVVWVVAGKKASLNHSDAVSG